MKVQGRVHKPRDAEDSRVAGNWERGLEEALTRSPQKEPMLPTPDIRLLASRPGRDQPHCYV